MKIGQSLAAFGGDLGAVEHVHYMVGFAWVFTKGFAAGLGIKEPVSSPTFTILQVYDEGRLPFYHFDVYRISDPEEMYEIGLEEYIEGEGVCFIEWALIPIEELGSLNTYVEIHIDKDLSKGFDYRLITVEEVQR